MNSSEDQSTLSMYHFPPWSASIHRPFSCAQPKENNAAAAETPKLTIDNRSSPDSSSKKRIIRHHVRIPTSSRLASPSPSHPRYSTPELSSAGDQRSSTSMSTRSHRTTAMQMKSAAVALPNANRKEKHGGQNFPKQTHEQRQTTNERKRRKQQAQTLVEKYSETETWFQLRRSLAELKRLAMTENLLLDPTTSAFNCDGFAFSTLKQIPRQALPIKSESGASSSFGSSLSSIDMIHGDSRRAKRSTEVFARMYFDPLTVESKTLHRGLLSRASSKCKPSVSPPTRLRSRTTLPSDQRRSQFLSSDLSHDDRTHTPSPSLIKLDSDVVSRRPISPSPVRRRLPSSIQLSSRVSLKPSIPRCRSASELKPSKSSARFLIVADEEHRIESWYHQYPFVLADDLLKLFQSKNATKSLVSGYFTDEVQSSNPNLTSKAFLHGKPFHIQDDWKKFDLIFLSEPVYESLIGDLRPLVQSTEENIPILRVDHQDELKKQVKHHCRHFQEQRHF